MAGYCARSRTGAIIKIKRLIGKGKWLLVKALSDGYLI
jgi:hypothetical protein